MSAPERIWVNLEFGEDKCYPVETEKFGDGKFYSAEDAEEYIRADKVSEMILQAVQAQRVACAVLVQACADAFSKVKDHPDVDQDIADKSKRMLRDIAAAIRARGDA